MAQSQFEKVLLSKKSLLPMTLEGPAGAGPKVAGTGDLVTYPTPPCCITLKLFDSLRKQFYFPEHMPQLRGSWRARSQFKPPNLEITHRVDRSWPTERRPSSAAAGVRHLGPFLTASFDNDLVVSITFLGTVSRFYVMSHGQCLDRSKSIFNVIRFDPLISALLELLCGCLGYPRSCGDSGGPGTELLENGPFLLPSPGAVEVLTPPPPPSVHSPHLGSLSVPMVFHTLRSAPCPLPIRGSQ